MLHSPHFNAKEQRKTLLNILYRHEKGALAMIEKQFAGVTMAPEVARVYEQKRAAVAKIEAALGKQKD